MRPRSNVLLGSALVLSACGATDFKGKAPQAAGGSTPQKTEVQLQVELDESKAIDPKLLPNANAPQCTAADEKIVRVALDCTFVTGKEKGKTEVIVRDGDKIVARFPIEVGGDAAPTVDAPAIIAKPGNASDDDPRSLKPGLETLDPKIPTRDDDIISTDGEGRGNGVGSPGSLDGAPMPPSDAPLRTIVCTKKDVLNVNGAPHAIGITFAPSECEGGYPDARFVGTLAKAEICGRDGSFTVRQAWESGGPGLAMWALGGCPGGVSPSQLQVVFRELPNGASGKAGGFVAEDPQDAYDVIVCEINDFFPRQDGKPYPIDLRFAAGHCGGKLPDGNYRGAIARGEICGEETSMIVQQPHVGVPGLSMWSLGSCPGTASPSQIQVVFFRTTAMRQCIKSNFSVADVSHPSGHQITFSPAECGGELPSASMIGVITAFEVCGNEQSITVAQPNEGSAGMSFWYLDGCPPGGGGSQLSALFMPR